MLKLNLRRVFTLRGIDRPIKWMMQAGISRPTANNLLNNYTDAINSTHMEKLCEILNCEPNDLYEWKPWKDTPNPETHPLKNLKRDPAPESIKQILDKIPLDRISKLDTLVEELNKNELSKES